MDIKFETAVPAATIFGLGVVGQPPTNTAGFWIEVARSKDEWIEIMPIPAYTTYAKD